MNAVHILLVHPDPAVLNLLRSMLQSLGQPLAEADSDRAAVKFLEKGNTDLVIAGVDPTDPEGLELLLYVRRKFSRVPVILLFDQPHPERTKEAMQRGATTILKQPVAAAQLRASVAQALGRVESELVIQGARQAVQARPGPFETNGAAAHPAPGHVGNGHGPENGHGHGYANSLSNGHGHGHAHVHEHAGPVITSLPGHFAAPPREVRSPLVGEDPCLRQTIELAETIAPTRASVLVLGDRGTGKAMLARAIHAQSLRHEGPFVEVSCMNMKEAALEVDLFGRKASYSDPLGDRPGKVAMAQGGTLYIDEVAALSPELQFKLLRLLQEGEYEPVGSTTTLRADVRVLFGSKENLTIWVEQGRLRQDLYGRVSVVTLKLPALKHRVEDVPRLAEFFRDRFVQDLGKPVIGFCPESITALKRHEWPGNVDELENVVERCVVHARGPRVEMDVVLKSIQDAALPRPSAPTAHRPPASKSIRPLKEALEEPEKRIILQALEALNWNRQETARVLDINRTTLYKKMKKYGLLFDEPVWVN